MQHKHQYHALLKQNQPENNLLVLQLLQSQQNWSSEKALSWTLRFLIQSINDIQTERFFYFGSIGLSFKVSKTRLPNESLSSTTIIYRMVLMSYALHNQQRILLHKVDYLEEEVHLFASYKTYLLENLNQILPTFAKQFTE